MLLILFMIKMSLPPIILNLTLFSFSAASVIVLGDGLNPDGTGSVTVHNGLEQWNVIYNPARASDTTQLNTIQIANVYDQGGTEITSSASGWDPLRVGGSDGYRTVTTFDLSSINLGSTDPHEITSATLWLESSGSNLSSGGVQIYEGSYIGSTALPATAIGGRDFSTDSISANKFYSFDILPVLLDINTDTSFTITLASSSGPESRFGSDFRQAGSNTGTAFSAPAPFLVINTTIASIPEPSVSILTFLSSLIICFRRKRH